MGKTSGGDATMDRYPFFFFLNSASSEGQKNQSYLLLYGNLQMSPYRGHPTAARPQLERAMSSYAGRGMKKGEEIKRE